MIRKLAFLLLALLVLGSGAQAAGPEGQGWISLFDGTLKGWKASENKGTFTVKDAGRRARRRALLPLRTG